MYSWMIVATDQDVTDLIGSCPCKIIKDLDNIKDEVCRIFGDICLIDDFEDLSKLNDEFQKYTKLFPEVYINNIHTYCVSESLYKIHYNKIIFEKDMRPKVLLCKFGIITKVSE